MQTPEAGEPGLMCCRVPFDGTLRSLDFWQLGGATKSRTDSESRYIA